MDTTTHSQPEVSPLESLKSFIYGGLATYSRTGDQDYLLAVKARVGDALGAVDPGEDLGSTTKENLAIVRNLIEGRETFYMEEAEEAAAACKDLWPKPTDGCTETIRRQAILSLAEGLRDNAMEETNIHEAHYRAFITLFCDDFARRRPKDDEARDEAIQRAHRLALRIVGAPIPAAQPIPDFCDAPAWCLAALEEVYRTRAKTVESFREWLRVEMKEYQGGSCDTAEDMVQLLQRFSEPMNEYIFRNTMGRIMQILSMKRIGTMQRVLDGMIAERDDVENLVALIRSGDIEDDSDGDCDVLSEDDAENEDESEDEDSFVE